MKWSLARVLALGLCLGQATAIHVATGSQCQSLCGNVHDSTSPDDVVCKENEYANSAAGMVFQQCTTCQLGSDYVSGRESDLQWLLYNLRYAVSYCVFGYPENDDVTSSPCLTSTACEPLKLAITHQDLAPNVTALEYCQTWVHDQMPRCGSCLRAAGEHYLTNFMSVLQGACEQMTPEGHTISVEGSPFSKTQLNVTDPTPVATDLPNYYPGPLNLDQRVGIAFGGIAILLMLSGFLIICRGRRRRRSFLKEMEVRASRDLGGWPHPIITNPPVAGEYFDSPGSQKPFRGWDDTPLSQKPLRDWDNSPHSMTAEKFHGRYISPYSSQYNSPDSAVEARNMTWPADKLQPQAQTTTKDIGLAFGGSEPSPMWEDSKGKGSAANESYELREVETQPGVVRAQVICPPTKPVYAHYYPEDYLDSPDEGLNRPKW